MSSYQMVCSVSLPVASDLSASQYCCVNLNSSGQVALPSAGGDIVGVMQDTEGSAANRVTAVATMFGAITKVKLGGTVTAGDYLKVDTSGRVVTATSGSFVVGRCVAGGAINNIGTMILGTTGGKMF